MVTDVIVGFCGETDAEFQNTYDLLERLRFDKVHVAAYSPRPGTIAHRKLADDVPAEVKQERLHAIEQLETRISLEINQRLLDSEQQVLVESRREGRWTGRNASRQAGTLRRRSGHRPDWSTSASNTRPRGHCKEQRSPRRYLRKMFGSLEIFVLPAADGRRRVRARRPHLERGRRPVRGTTQGSAIVPWQQPARAPKPPLVAVVVVILTVVDDDLRCC